MLADVFNSTRHDELMEWGFTSKEVFTASVSAPNNNRYPLQRPSYMKIDSSNIFTGSEQLGSSKGLPSQAIIGLNKICRKIITKLRIFNQMFTQGTA